jgi:hypothetical protein
MMKYELMMKYGVKNNMQMTQIEWIYAVFFTGLTGFVELTGLTRFAGLTRFQSCVDWEKIRRIFSFVKFVKIHRILNSCNSCNSWIKKSGLKKVD